VPALALAAMAVALSCTGRVTAPHTDPGSPGATGSGGRGGSGRGGSGPTAGAAGTGPMSTGGSGATSGTGPAAPVACQPGGEPAPTALRRLSTRQYRNTVRDLLAGSGLRIVADEARDLLAAMPEDSAGRFRGLDNRISAEHVAAAFRLANAVAEGASRPDRLATFAGSCAATAPLSGRCLDDFLDGFGRRAWRRPLTAGERSDLHALNDGQRSPADVIQMVTVLLMTSPRFLNHLELDGTPVAGRQDHLALSPHEVAARLSYTFWETMPDEQLFAAAAATGPESLATDSGFRKQLDRVFADPRTRATLWQFWNEWLRLESFTGFASSRPGWRSLAAGETLGAGGRDDYGDMVDELRALTEHFTWTRKSTLADLLTTDLSVTRAPALARLYQVAPWSGNGEFPRLGPERSGLLHRAALLVSSLETTNPFHRGAFVRRQLLCDPLPQPDPNSLPPGALDPPPPSAAETTRQRFARKTDAALCLPCHQQFNDLGFVLEAFDALGRHRSTEKVFDEQNGRLLAELPIDARGVAAVDPADRRPVDGPAELNRRIVESKKVEACLAQQYFQYSFRREPAAGDACLVDQLRASLVQPSPGTGLDETFKIIALDPEFRRRKVGEVTP
jgi:Protein of unknown function (DUF1588)/Protein of unknown function (DUF1592)/Protein of unknown function (DUF1595)/Protein of unknown function (DUF1585)/Protein of unknown function (DUF1587)